MNIYIGMSIIIILGSLMYLMQRESFDQKTEVINQLKNTMDVSKALLRRRV